MDNFSKPMQYSAEQQQMCNAFRNVYATLPNANGAYFGYGPQARPQFQAFSEEYDDDEDDEQMRTLFCNNLDERVTEEILYEVFLQAGPIESARIPLDNTGRQRNFGFVTYQHRSAVPYAVKLYQGLELFQKKVSIRQHRPRQGSSGNATNDHVGPSRHDNKNKFNRDDIRRQSDESNRRRMHQQHSQQWR